MANVKQYLDKKKRFLFSSYWILPVTTVAEWLTLCFKVARSHYVDEHKHIILDHHHWINSLKLLILNVLLHRIVFLPQLPTLSCSNISSLISQICSLHFCFLYNNNRFMYLWCWTDLLLFNAFTSPLSVLTLTWESPKYDKKGSGFCWTSGRCLKPHLDCRVSRLL